MTTIGEWVNVSSGTGSSGLSQSPDNHKMVVTNVIDYFCHNYSMDCLADAMGFLSVCPFKQPPLLNIIKPKSVYPETHCEGTVVNLLQLNLQSTCMQVKSNNKAK